MKQRFLTATIALAMLTAPSAQAELAGRDTTKRDSMKTVLGDRLSSGGYGGPVIQFGEVAGRFAILLGGEGAWVINHRFLLGGRGVGLASENARRVPVAGGSAMPVGMGYGGVFVGYIIRPNEIVHGTLSMLIGGGEAGIKNASGAMDRPDAIAVFEPSVEFEVNLVHWLRLGFGGAYRFIADADVFGMGVRDFDGPFAQLTIRFGSF